MVVRDPYGIFDGTSICTYPQLIIELKRVDVYMTQTARNHMSSY